MVKNEREDREGLLQDIGRISDKSIGILDDIR
jgi:hypothetical protein